MCARAVDVTDADQRAAQDAHALVYERIGSAAEKRQGERLRRTLIAKLDPTRFDIMTSYWCEACESIFVRRRPPGEPIRLPPVEDAALSHLSAVDVPVAPPKSIEIGRRKARTSTGFHRLVGRGLASEVGEGATAKFSLTEKGRLVLQERA